jgi:hypothetical protein
MSFTIDMSRSNLCFKLCLLERGVQVTTYDFEFMDNSITNEFDCSLYATKNTSMHPEQMKVYTRTYVQNVKGFFE